jgi:hypothetical protein
MSDFGPTTDIVTVQLPKKFVEHLRSTAGVLWPEDEFNQIYEDVVTCGNADDTYAEGEGQGAAAVAAEILRYIPA